MRVSEFVCVCVCVRVYVHLGYFSSQFEVTCELVECGCHQQTFSLLFVLFNNFYNKISLWFGWFLRKITFFAPKKVSI